VSAPDCTPEMIALWQELDEAIDRIALWQELDEAIDRFDAAPIMQAREIAITVVRIARELLERHDEEQMAALAATKEPASCAP
jgi:hypothetical protein